MNTSIHIPDSLAARLQKYLEHNPGSSSRNSIIVEAIEEYLNKQENSSTWSDEFLSWQGYPGLEIDRSQENWEEKDVFA